MMGSDVLMILLRHFHIGVKMMYDKHSRRQCDIYPY